MCRNGLCGAYDCSTCRPGNDYDLEQQDAMDVHMESMGEEQRDQEMQAKPGE